MNQRPLPFFTASPKAGDPLDIAFDASASRDADGRVVGWNWDFGDGLRGSGQVVTHRYQAHGTYTVKLTVIDDQGARSGTSLSVEAVDPSAGGRQLPGDGNQDRSLDISDALILILYLFGDAGRPPPCDGATVHEGGNRTLLDLNADLEVDLTDAIHLLSYLFTAGAPPAAGVSCIPIAGCPDACAR
jgi:hypothetical protein